MTSHHPNTTWHNLHFSTSSAKPAPTKILKIVIFDLIPYEREKDPVWSRKFGLTLKGFFRMEKTFDSLDPASMTLEKKLRAINGILELEVWSLDLFVERCSTTRANPTTIEFQRPRIIPMISQFLSFTYSYLAHFLNAARLGFFVFRENFAIRKRDLAFFSTCN